MTAPGSHEVGPCPGNRALRRWGSTWEGRGSLSLLYLSPHPLPETGGRRVVSHEVVLGGKLAAKTSFSISRSSSPRVEDLKGEPGSGEQPSRLRHSRTGYPPAPSRPHQGPTASTACLSTGAALYGRLKEYLLTEEQLKENGYPFLHPERPGGAVIFTTEDKPPKDCESPPATCAPQRVRRGGCGRRASCLTLLSTVPTPQPLVGSAAAVAPSTSCPPRAAVCEMRSVTITGDGSAETEVRPQHAPSPLPPPPLLNFLSFCCTL